MWNGLKIVFKNLGLMALLIIGLLLLVIFTADLYTRKGQTQEVPKVTGLNYDKATEILDDHDLDYTIIDSVYDENAPRNSVTEQNPTPLSVVKKGRRIYLTVNCLGIPEVEMPDLAGKSSFDQAKKILAAKGLYLGNVTRQPDPTVTNPSEEPVFEQLYHGKPINPGTKIKKKSKIDLVIGCMISSDTLSDGSLKNPEDNIGDVSSTETKH